jgi:predicted nucleic acid-binding protein
VRVILDTNVVLSALIRPAEAGRLVNQIRALAEPVSRLPAA